LGYMRAPSKKIEAVTARESSGLVADATPTAETVTRISPFRVSTLVSVAPVQLVHDFGTMSRHEGDPVPHEHQFYRATLQGLFSLDLHAAGTFSYVKRTGYLNLDEPRIQEAQSGGLEHLAQEQAYRLPFEQRIARIQALLAGIVHLEGGAKQALHYTDVNPDLLFLAVTRGGNHIFGHIIGRDERDRPVLHLDALVEALTVHKDDVLSDIYVGWVRGFLDGERAKLVTTLDSDERMTAWKGRFHLAHPREVVEHLVQDLKAHPEWLA
ncbi:MAG: type I-B CRISPR-associated protein Cas7/Cst2/DevR, partial [Nitrospinota bacterium]